MKMVKAHVFDDTSTTKATSKVTWEGVVGLDVILIQECETPARRGAKEFLEDPVASGREGDQDDTASSS